MASLREWQERLYLTDWILSVRLVQMSEIPGDAGRIEMEFGGHSGVVRLVIPDEETRRDGIVRFCHEKTLVHELLHCKYNWLKAPDTYEGKYLDVCEHALLEQMSRSLIMAKYNLKPDWFANIA